MMSPSLELNAFSKARLSLKSNLGSLSSQCENDCDSLMFLEIPFSPFQSEWSDNEDHAHGLRGYQRNSNRQMYLRSYPFSRKLTLSDRAKIVLRKLKAVAWAVIACNYKSIDSRKLKNLYNRRVSKYFGAGHFIPSSLSGAHRHRRMGVVAS